MRSTQWLKNKFFFLQPYFQGYTMKNLEVAVSVLQLISVIMFTGGAQVNFPNLPPISLCPADREEPWTYRGLNGPSFWGRTYPQCNGRQQSPIRINSNDAVRDENLSQLSLDGYDFPVSTATIENNGHTIEVTPSDGVERTISVNGGTYTLQQFHFHWGKTSSKGAEHILDGVQYAMEMHLVHTDASGNIAVVGIFFQEQKDVNKDLQPIVDQLPNVRYKDSESQLRSELNLNNLLPSNPTSFYRYDGSLTTPECTEGVTWSVVPQPITVGKSQMAEFRKLYSAARDEATFGCQLSGNYRPVQPLNGRQVFLSQ